MMNEFSTSILALIVSLVALSWTVYSNLRQQKQVATIANLTQVINVEQKLANAQSALRFHGIDQEELKEYELTPDEFIYLLTNFTFGRIYHEINTPYSVIPYTKDSYRYNLLKSHATRKAWHLLKRMMVQSKYVDKIEATLHKIQEIEGS